MSEIEKDVGVSVSILIFTIKDGKLCAVLQRRGEWDHEKDCEQSFALALQVTVHGKIKFMDLMPAFKRETEEEIGENIARILSQTQDLMPFKETEREKVLRALWFLKYEVLVEEVQLHKSCQELVYISEEEVAELKILDKSMKKTGVRDATNRLFPDELELIKEGFPMMKKKIKSANPDMNLEDI